MNLKHENLFFLWVVLVCASLLGAGACKAKKLPPPEFKTESFAQGLQGCDPEGPDCTYVKMEYPVFTGGADGESLKRLNEAVQKSLESPFIEDKPQKPEALAKALFAEYDGFKKESPGYAQSWMLERVIKAEVVSSKIVTLAMTEYSYTGGAHPNSFESYQNLDIKTGQALGLDDLLKPDYQQPLNDTAEKIFREQEGLSFDENLEEAGFFFEEAKFKLNENFRITADGLVFLFNPYEAAPYVRGPIELKVPYSRIQDWIRPKGPLADLAKK
jgi:hypothetical protein